MAKKTAKKSSKKKTAKKKTAKKVKSKALEPEIIEPEIIEPDDESVDENKLELPVTFDDIDPDDPIFNDSKALASSKNIATSTDSLSRYMAEVSRYPLLSREEEKALAIKYYETGDRDAAQKLVTSNLRFVVKVAMEYSKFGAKVIDLIQEGNVGLMQAVKDFNPYKGVRLISYAVWWIRGQISEHLMRHYSMVRIGTTAKQRKLFYQLQRQKDQLERVGFEAGIAQLSGRLGIPEEEVAEMGKRVLHRDVSLDKPATADSGNTLLDSQSEEVPMADDVVALKENIDLLREKLSEMEDEMNEREKLILEERLLSEDPITLQEVGNRYGITREAARQIEARLIDKIKKRF